MKIWVKVARLTCAVVALSLTSISCMEMGSSEESDGSDDQQQLAGSAGGDFSVTVAEDGSLSAGIGALTPGENVAVTQLPVFGQLSLNSQTGTYTYTPVANYFGPDLFKYTIYQGVAPVGSGT